LTSYHNRLNSILENSLVNQDAILIITDISIKNKVAILVSHIYRGQEIIVKSVHHTINITFTEAKLFTIRCEINYVVQLQDITCIIVITDMILAAKQIFNSSFHLYELYSIVISKDLRCFFKRNLNNTINFWDCPDSIKWSPHLLVDKESKHIKIDSVFSSKTS